MKKYIAIASALLLGTAVASHRHRDHGRREGHHQSNHHDSDQRNTFISKIEYNLRAHRLPEVFMNLALRAVQSLEAHQIKQLFELEEKFDDFDWTEALNTLEAIRIEHDLEYVLKAFLSPRHTKTMVKYLQKELKHRQQQLEKRQRELEREKELEEREKEREERQKEREIRDQQRQKERAQREKEREKQLEEREKEIKQREKEQEELDKKKHEHDKSHQGTDDNKHHPDDDKGHTVIIKPRPANKDETQTIKLSPSPGSNWNIKSSGGEGNLFTFSFKGKDSKKQASTVDVNYSEPKVQQYYVTDYEPYPVFYPDVQDTVWNFKESGKSSGNSVNVIINNPRERPVLNFNEPRPSRQSKHKRSYDYDSSW